MPGTRRRLRPLKPRSITCAPRRTVSAQRVTRADVVWTFSGVRPLDDGANAASAATRDYVLELDNDGPPLLIFGGKLRPIAGWPSTCSTSWTRPFRRLGLGATGAWRRCRAGRSPRRSSRRGRPCDFAIRGFTTAKGASSYAGLRTSGERDIGRGERASGARTRLRRGLERERGRLSDAGRMGRMRRGRRVAPLQAGLRLSADAIAALDRFIAGRLAEGGQSLSAQRTPA